MLKMVVALLAAITVAITLPAQKTGSSEELKKKQAAIQREIDDLKHTLQVAQKSKKAGLAQLEMVKKQLRLRQQAIANVNEQIGVIEGSIGQSRKEIDVLKAELDTLKQEYASAIVNAYKNRSNYDYLNFIFSAPSFNDALRRIQYLHFYKEYREQQAATIKNTQQLIQEKLNRLELTRKEKDAVLQNQQKQKLSLEDEKKKKNSLVNELKAHEKEISKELAVKRRTDAKLRREIARVIDLEIRMAQKEAAEKEKRDAVAMAKTSKVVAAKLTKEPKKNPLAATPEGIRMSGNFERQKGHLPWPVDKAVVKVHFGPYKVPGTDNIHGNNPGITLATETGATVKSVFEGDVSSVFSVENNWNVVVHHGKYFTVYSNLSSISVTRNQRVTAGQMLGRAAADTDGDGSIDFILMQERRNVNPELWLRRR